MTGIFSRLFGGRATPETRGQSTLDVLGAAFGYRVGGAGMSPVMAENLATVTGCIGAIASILASNPLRIYRLDAEGRTETTSHPINRLLRTPNDFQTGPDFVEWLMASTLLHGNGIAAIERDGAGRPAALIPIQWPHVRVSMLASGRMAYDVTASTFPYGPAGPPKRYLQDDVLHLRDRSDDGLIGRSRLSRAPAVLENASALQEFSLAGWRNGGTPSGAIEVDGPINDTTYKRLSARLDEMVRGVANARKVLILDNKANWKSISVSPEDAEVLSSRRFSTEEICRIYQVPPPIVQDYTHNTFTNSVQASRWFAQFTLTPWARKVEAVVSRALLSTGFALEIDLAGLLRGDPEARWAANVAAVGAGILTVDEVREQEGFGPLPKPPPPAPGAAPGAGAVAGGGVSASATASHMPGKMNGAAAPPGGP